MKFLAKKYKNRDNLIKDIRSQLGSDIDKNNDVENCIEGKIEELVKLGLIEGRSILGVRCKATDLKEKDRGQSMSKLRKKQK